MDHNSLNTYDSPPSNLVIDFREDFLEPTLSSTRWVPHYLPQWTTPDRSKAFYTIRSGILTLEIRADQLSWLPSDSHLRVSSIQTALFSGILGSGRGTHRHRPDIYVQTPQTLLRLYTPKAPARIEATLRAHPHSDCMLAFWLVGLEDDHPEDSGEICVAEIFGDKTGIVDKDNGKRITELNVGVKKHSDAQLMDDMTKIVLQDFDACEWHKYSAEWDENEIRILVDGQLVKTSFQTIRYPMQVMIDLFEFPESEEYRREQKYPKKGDVKQVLGGKFV